MSPDGLRWWILFLVIALAGIVVYAQYEKTVPCARPIAYAIGDVDARFGVSTTTLLSETKAAAAIWNKAEGKTLLTYDPNAALKISLIYDERQATANAGKTIAAAQAHEDVSRSQLDSMQAQFQSEQKAYNQKVSAINANGGGTPSEVAELNAERDALKSLADSINAKVAGFNATIDLQNANVQQYNQSAAQSFKEGEYVQDTSGKHISIFEFIGNVQLERVLAHEFGHAIGLDHNSNPKSIMYAQNESGNLIPTADDLAALKVACGG